MQRDQLKILYDIHSWVGILFGLLIYVICFTGSIALFQKELWLWERPYLDLGFDGDRVKIDQAVRDVLEHYPQNPGAVSVELPHYYYPAIKINVVGGGLWNIHNYHPQSGLPIDITELGLSRFLKSIHTDLWLPSPYGRYLVGVLGLVFIFMIVLGLVIHRHIFKDLFTFRPYRSLRLLYSDAHKALGVWGILFHLMISYTGALLGLAGILTGIMAFGVYEGGKKEVVESIYGKSSAPSGIQASMINLDELLAQVKNYSRGSQVERLTIRNARDKNVTITVSVHDYQTASTLSGPKVLTYDGVHGELLNEVSAFNQGTGFRIYEGVQPLHYGTYGGIVLKLVYALLGLSSSMIVITGILIWLEKRCGQVRSKVSQYRMLSCLALGVIAGLPLATFSAFYATRLFSDISDRLFWIGLVYFSVWVLTVVYVFWLNNSAQAIRALLYKAAVLALGIPLIDIIYMREELLSKSMAVLSVDLSAFVIGMLLLTVIGRLPAAAK